MRVLVSFWRNRTWRKWVKSALAHTDLDPSLFSHFTATIAKWRYGTIPLSMEQLLELRAVHEHHLAMEMFADAQDKEFIKKVIQAAHDKEMDLYEVYVHTCLSSL